MFDVIVVGGGPAGLSAALMLGRCRRRVLVCDAGQPRNRRSRALHGYLTRDGIAPSEFNDAGRRELAPYGVELREAVVQGAERVDGRFRVSLAGGRSEDAQVSAAGNRVADDLPPVAGPRGVLRPLGVSLSVLRRLGMARSPARSPWQRETRPGAGPFAGNMEPSYLAVHQWQPCAPGGTDPAY